MFSFLSVILKIKPLDDSFFVLASRSGAKDLGIERRQKKNSGSQRVVRVRPRPRSGRHFQIR